MTPSVLVLFYLLRAVCVSFDIFLLPCLPLPTTLIYEHRNIKISSLGSETDHPPLHSIVFVFVSPEIFSVGQAAIEWVATENSPPLNRSFVDSMKKYYRREHPETETLSRAWSFNKFYARPPRPPVHINRKKCHALQFNKARHVINFNFNDQLVLASPSTSTSICLSSSIGKIREKPF